MRRTAMAVIALALLAGMVACGSDSSGDLVGPTWQWTGLVENAPKHQSAIPDPENYTLTFADDGQHTGRQSQTWFAIDGDQMTVQLAADAGEMQFTQA